MLQCLYSHLSPTATSTTKTMCKSSYSCHNIHNVIGQWLQIFFAFNTYSYSARCHPNVWQQDIQLRHSFFYVLQHSSSVVSSSPVPCSKLSTKVSNGLPGDNIPWEGSHVTVGWAGDVLFLKMYPASLVLIISGTWLRPLYSRSFAIVVKPLDVVVFLQHACVVTIKFFLLRFW